MRVVSMAPSDVALGNVSPLAGTLDVGHNAGNPPLFPQFAKETCPVCYYWK